jgi:formate hydrogenlyase subunit 6/NADH:ubiquinone oxidoreductase subunit I
MFRDVIESVFQKPVTETYPTEKDTPPSTLRGKLRWTPDGCTGCMLCVKDCPADAIHLITLDKAAKRFVMAYHVDRCIYCGQCVQSCRFDCLTLQNDTWELADGSKSSYTVFYGAPDDVATVLRSETPADRGAP